MYESNGDVHLRCIAAPDPGDDEDNDNDGFSENQGDCDDTDADVNPNATEVADGIDNDCDGLVDEGLGPQDGEACDDGNPFTDPDVYENGQCVSGPCPDDAASNSALLPTNLGSFPGDSGGDPIQRVQRTGVICAGTSDFFFVQIEEDSSLCQFLSAEIEVDSTGALRLVASGAPIFGLGGSTDDVSGGTAMVFAYAADPCFGEDNSFPLFIEVRGQSSGIAAAYTLTIFTDVP